MVAIVSVQNQIFSGDREDFTKVARAVSQAESHFLLIFAGSLTQLVKSYPGITVHLRLTVAKQIELLRERYGRIKEKTSAVPLQSGLDEKWWADFPWNVIVICENFQD